jgi:hypothetical protein
MGRNHLGDVGIDWRIILKWLYGVKDWIYLIGIGCKDELL